MTITPDQTAAYYEAKGRALGEQDDTTETLHRCRGVGAVLGTECNQCDGLLDDPSCPLCLRCCDTELLDCACVSAIGGDSDCPGCDGLLVVTDRNEWCDRCGLTGNCPDCDPDTYLDARRDR